MWKYVQRLFLLVVFSMHILYVACHALEGREHKSRVTGFSYLSPPKTGLCKQILNINFFFPFYTPDCSELSLQYIFIYIYIK